MKRYTSCFEHRTHPFNITHIIADGACSIIKSLLLTDGVSAIENPPHQNGGIRSIIVLHSDQKGDQKDGRVIQNDKMTPDESKWFKPAAHTYQSLRIIRCAGVCRATPTTHASSWCPVVRAIWILANGYCTAKLPRSVPPAPGVPRHRPFTAQLACRRRTSQNDCYTILNQHNDH